MYILNCRNSNFYTLPEVKSKRAAAFGYGTKYDFTKENKDKSQVFYNTSKGFNPESSHAPKYSFGISRNFFDKVYYESNKMIDKNVPGPAKYLTYKPFGSEAPKYSMTGKGIDIMKKVKSKEPGPGEYKHMTMTIEGKYPLSKFRNTATITFGINKEKRFNYNVKEKTPGPDSYNIKNMIDGKGFIYPSRFRSATASSITGKGKDLSTKYTNYKSKINLILAPGPGSYRIFSEFGIYEKERVTSTK